MIHSCEKELESKYPGHSQAKDGERWTCSCGKIFEHVCDEAEGCYWVPYVKAVHDEHYRKARIKKRITEAQSTVSMPRKRKQCRRK